MHQSSLQHALTQNVSLNELSLKKQNLNINILDLLFKSHNQLLNKTFIILSS